MAWPGKMSFFDWLVKVCCLRLGTLSRYRHLSKIMPYSDFPSHRNAVVHPTDSLHPDGIFVLPKPWKCRNHRLQFPQQSFSTVPNPKFVSVSPSLLPSLPFQITLAFPCITEYHSHRLETWNINPLICSAKPLPRPYFDARRGAPFSEDLFELFCELRTHLIPILLGNMNAKSRQNKSYLLYSTWST